MSSTSGRGPARTAGLHDEAVEIAQRVINGDVGVIAGCRELTRLGHQVVDDWRADPDFVVFGAIQSETDHLPLEDLRPLWQPEAFAAKQSEVAQWESFYREKVLLACRSILQRFGPKTDTPPA